jgi:DNA polymerase-3 subunit alpha
MSKCLTIQLPLTVLSTDFMEQIDEIVKTNAEQNPERKCQLKFMILDYDEETVLEMPSKTIKISPSNEFLEKISNLTGVRYKLN